MPSRFLVVELPLGENGLSGSRDQTTIPPSALITANNLSYSDGTLKKEGGSSKYNTISVSGKIIGGHDWFPTALLQRQIIGVDDGRIMRAEGPGDTGTFSNITTGLTMTKGSVFFVDGGFEDAANNKKLFIFTGSDAVRFIDGDGITTAVIPDPPADWTGTNQPSFGLIHIDRLWGGGNANDPHRIYFSSVSNHGSFTGGGSLSIFPGQGQELVAAVSFKAFIICFKFPAGIYIIDTTSTVITNWRVDRLNDQIGIAGTNAWAVIDNDIIFMDSTGNIQLLSIIDFESRNSSSLSKIADMNQWVRDNINLGSIKNTRAIYYPAKREVHFCLAGLGGTSNTQRIVVDFNADRPRFRTSDKDVCESAWLKLDLDNIPRLTTGDDVGFVWNLDQSTRSKDGAAYNGLWQTPHMDMSHIDPALATVRKNAHWLELVLEPSGNWNMDITLIYDDAVHSTVSFNMGGDSAVLGSFILGTSVLGGSEIVTSKKRITGSFRRVSFQGSNAVAAQDFSLAKMYLHFLPGTERL